MKKKNIKIGVFLGEKRVFNVAMQSRNYQNCSIRDIIKKIEQKYETMTMNFLIRSFFSGEFMKK
ncbi:hypothetical protein BpHYR1_044366 [Brachionus plicatilis]|uniref:Uncharacterized protein n=1 Tax=Brachionus plicatilis TaxID=10195 RepID=A0A3M7STC1_BRAPC|nr:hypothetical protein BpHYR1_044366 [Brachionus plicatilis]